jgi:hypothetical protein
VTSDTPVPRRLTLADLAPSHPADRTLQNLLSVLSATLDLCSRLPIYEYEAASEGHQAAAEAFHELAMVERRAVNGLIVRLRDHVDEVVGEPLHGTEAAQR